MADSRRNKKPKTLKIDFSDTTSRRLVDEGSYLVEVVKVEQKEGTKAPYLNWEFEITDEDFTGSKLWAITSLSASSLWNLRALLEAMGYEIPTGVFDLDLKDVVGLTLGVNVEHEKYQGKEKAKITDYFYPEEPGDEEPEEPGDEEPEEPEPAKKPTKKERRNRRAKKKES